MVEDGQTVQEEDQWIILIVTAGFTDCVLAGQKNASWRQSISDIQC